MDKVKEIIETIQQLQNTTEHINTQHTQQAIEECVHALKEYAADQLLSGLDVTTDDEEFLEKTTQKAEEKMERKVNYDRVGIKVVSTEERHKLMDVYEKLGWQWYMGDDPHDYNPFEKLDEDVYIEVKNNFRCSSDSGDYDTLDIDEGLEYMDKHYGHLIEEEEEDARKIVIQSLIDYDVLMGLCEENDIQRATGNEATNYSTRAVIEDILKENEYVIIFLCEQGLSWTAMANKQEAIDAHSVIEELQRAPRFLPISEIMEETGDSYNKIYNRLDIDTQEREEDVERTKKEGSTLLVNYNRYRKRFEGKMGETLSVAEKLDTNKETIIEKLHNGETQGDIAQWLEISDSSVSNRIHEHDLQDIKKKAEKDMPTFLEQYGDPIDE